MTNKEIESRTEPLIYTRREAAQIARMSIASFDEALKRREFPYLRIGRRILIPRVAFERALLANQSSD